MINIAGVKRDTPHRYPFLMIDRVLEFTVGESITALKNVTCNEEYFNGHFPEQPVMPGVLMIEALAQASGLLIFYTTNARADADANWYFLAGVDKARFKRIVEPGDQLHLCSRIIKNKRDLWFFDTRATVNGEVACSAELLIARGRLK